MTTLLNPPPVELTFEDATHLRAWVAALRSGEYIQFQGGNLCNLEKTAFCCLGVERIIAHCTFVAPPRSSRFRWVRGSSWYFTEWDIPLPSGELLSNWFYRNFIYFSHPDTGTLYDLTFVSMNDELRLTFAQIADVIDYLIDNSPTKDM